VVAASRCGVSSRLLESLRALAWLCRWPGLRAWTAADFLRCTIGGRSGQVGSACDVGSWGRRLVDVGAGARRVGLERDAKRFQQISENCSVCAKMHRDDKQRPFESVYPDPQTDYHRLGDEAVHGVVQHVICPADFVIRRPPIHDGSGQIADDVDVSEQYGRRNPPNLIDVSEERDDANAQCEPIFGANKHKRSLGLESVDAIHSSTLQVC